MSKTTIDELQVLISANSSKFQSEIAKVRENLAQVSQSARGSGESITGGFLKAQLALGVLRGAFSAVVGVAKAATSEFGSLEQNLGGAEAVFGQFSDAVKQKSKESAQTMGTSMSQYLAAANKMGSLFQGAGYDVQKSMIMTTKAMQRAADVASVMGISQEAALESVAGMAKGNFTMMDNLGVAMNDTALSAYMLEKGIQGNIEKMTTGEKVGIAYQMFMDRTGKYAGNFARESMTLEGALAILRAELSNVAATLGSAFAPVVLSVSNFVSSVLIPAINAAIPYIVGFMKVIGTMVNYVISAISSLFGVTKKAGGALGFGGVSKAADSASKGMSNLGKSAGGSGGAGGMNKAAGSAKKLKKELLGLAKFDEMNVLKTPEDTGSGGGGGGAGSGGGGGVDFDMPEIPTGGFKNAFDDIGLKAEEIANKIKGFFSDMFDFKKIGSAFKRFWDDIKATAKPVFEVIGDAWERYLKPIISWAGNELLPAFLNAVGGAARFLGEMFKSAYNFSRPFIDAFIAPLVGFIGSGIVKFLNGIGDAFRAMSKDKGLVDFLTQITITIGGMTVAIKAAEAISAFNAGVKTMQALALSSPQAMASMVSSLGSVKSAFVLAGGGIAGIKASVIALGASIKTSVIGAFNTVMAHPLILAIAGIAAGFAFLGGSIKSAFEQGNPAMWESEARAKALKKAQEDLQKAVDGVKTAEENLKNARNSETDANLQRIEAVKAQKRAMEELAIAQQQTGISFESVKSQIESGTLAFENLTPQQQAVYEKGLLLEQANQKVQTSQDNMNKAIQDTKSKTEELKKAKDEELAQRLADATSQAVIQGKYKNSKDAIDALKSGVLQYKDENGNMVKVSEEDISRLENTTKTKSQDIVKTYRDSKSGADQGFFGPMGKSLATAGDQLGKFAGWAGEKFGEFISWAKKAGSDAWNGITSFFGGIGQWFSDRWGDIKNAFSNAWQTFSNIGRNIWEGLKSGIGNIANNMRNMFSGAVEGVKKFLGIHSPSRLFKSYGGFVSEGFALGIQGEMSTVSKAFTKMTDFEIPEYTVKTNFDVDTPDYGVDQTVKAHLDYQSKLDKEHETAMDKIEEAIRNQKQQITVKVGEDTLVDKIIDGVNAKSFLENRTVFDI